MKLKWKNPTLVEIHPQEEDSHIETFCGTIDMEFDSIEPAYADEDNLILNIFNEVMIIVPKNSFTFC